MVKKTLLGELPGDLPDELVEEIAGCPDVRIERIVSRGHASPEGFWYHQPQREFVLLVQGRAALLFEGDDHEVVLEPGDYLSIERYRKHRVQWTAPDGDTVWLAVHFG